ncbi:putative membrane protein [Microvirga flocculans]|uniref:Putative membrane protein n=1 Tax=Microvirga flocculans TaxID=217168 RepID=A0A7W6IDJ3_9HYPH|nr:DUF2269 domain-containing protein [Microvirga flocculans]MBB4039500.1 putative membrane protein [Microvirga flocculans]
MELLDLLRWFHVIGATVLLGTGAGIAFFMLMAHRTRHPALIAHVASTVVTADMVFTSTAVIVQPLTGVSLAYLIGWPLTEGWVVLSLGLYGLTGLFWLPVVWIQIRMRDLARAAAKEKRLLPKQYDRLFAIWFACGIPAFLCVLAIVWLMLAKPSLPLF